MNDLRVYNSILELLPTENNPTPLVKLNKLPFKKLQVYAKLEWYNPFGSIKDRIASYMMKDAENKGLTNSKKLVEPTSGNTGIGLANIANLKGYKLTTPLSKEIPSEKKNLLRFFGTNVLELNDTLCPAPWAPEGAIAKAKQLSQEENYYMLNQYENIANVQAHYTTTGPEIWKQTNQKITQFIAGLGTCGTITGTGKFLKEKNSKVKVIGIYPEEGHDIPGVRSIKQLKQTKLYTPENYDEMKEVSTKEAYDMCLKLNREEGIIAGPSSGMAVAGALKTLKDEEGIAVIIFPDNVFKYISSLEKHFPEIFPKKEELKTSAQIPNLEVIKEIIERARNEFNTIEPEEVKNLDDIEIIDVRPKEIFEQSHLPKAKNIPLNELSQKYSEQNKNKQIITVCNRGNTSIYGMLLLKSLGFKNVKSMNSGTLGWIEKGYDVEKN